MFVRRLGGIVADIIKSVLIALVIVMFLKGSAVEANQIVSSSMTPTLLEGDFILVNKFKYGLHLPFINKMLFTWSKPERGDVVTFMPPSSLGSARGKVFIKRIIAVPGDRVQIIKSMLFINGKQAPTQPFSSRKHVYKEWIGGKEHTIMKYDEDSSFGPVTVPEGYVFAVGDNRDNSHDSRAWGPLPIENIQGKAEVIYFTRALNSVTGNLGRIGNIL